MYCINNTISKTIIVSRIDICTFLLIKQHGNILLYFIIGGDLNRESSLCYNELSFKKRSSWAFPMRP